MSFDQAKQQAWDLFNAGQYGLALDAITRALSLEPDDAGALYLLSLSLTNVGRYGEAVEAAERALASAPGWSAAHHARGMAVLHEDRRFLILENGRLDKSAKLPPRLAQAESDCREAIRQEPECGMYWRILAEVLYHVRRVDEAEEAIRKAIALEPTESWNHELLARISRDQARLDLAEDACREGLRLSPERWVLHWIMGWILLETKRPQQSLEHFRTSLRLWPHAVVARAGLLEALKAEYATYRWVQRPLMWLDALMDDPKRMGKGERRVKLITFILVLTLGTLFLPIPGIGYRLLVSTLIGVVLLAMLTYSIIAAILVYFALRETANLILLVHPFGRMVLSKRERLFTVLVAGISMPLLAVILWTVIRVVAGVPNGIGKWIALAIVSVWLLIPWLACWAGTATTRLAKAGRIMGISALAVWGVAAAVPAVRGPLVHGSMPWVILGLGILTLFLLVRRA